MSTEQLKKALAPASAQRQLQQSLAALLSDPRLKAQIAAALPKHVTADRIARVALTEVRRNPALARCDQHSFLGALMMCAQLGLEPGGPLGHAYLVPFQNSKAGRIEAQFVLGYRGMIELARRSGRIASIEARAVYEDDRFKCRFGLESELVHEPDWESPNRTPDKIRFVYAIARLKDGGVQFVVLPRRDIEAARAASRAAQGPWQTHYEQMALKTAVRQLFKWLPVSVEIAEAIEQEERADAGLPQDYPQLAEADGEPAASEPEPAAGTGEARETREDRQ